MSFQDRAQHQIGQIDKEVGRLEAIISLPPYQGFLEALRYHEAQSC